MIINKTTFRQKWRNYSKHPTSLILFALVYFSYADRRFSPRVLFGYIVIKGVPNLKWSLFAWEYNSENASMMPAIINTIVMYVLVACDLRAARRLFRDLHDGVRAARQPAR
jgi:phosphate transport system permease protein